MNHNCWDNVIEIKDPAGLFTPACTVNPISLLPSSLNVFTRGLLVRNVLEYVNNHYYL